jgi:hypothetical protein
MTTRKQGQPAAGASAGSESGAGKRKAWIKKTPVEIIMEQVDKQK